MVFHVYTRDSVGNVYCLFVLKVIKDRLDKIIYDHDFNSVKFVRAQFAQPT